MNNLGNIITIINLIEYSSKVIEYILIKLLVFKIYFPIFIIFIAIGILIYLLKG